jgi:predicted DNA-binding transcriptional regulator AlpA
MTQFATFLRPVRAAVGARSTDRRAGGIRAVMDRLLTAEAVAARLGVRPQWVWAQACAGRIPHVRLVRYRRFRESAIEAWIFDLERESRQPASHPIAAGRGR